MTRLGISLTRLSTAQGAQHEGNRAAHSTDIYSCRARIFSRIGGIFYLGFAMGPALGNLFVKLHPKHTSDQVFYLSICLAMINLTLVMLVVPESVSPEERQRRHDLAAAAKEQKRLEGAGLWRSIRDAVSSFFAPLGLFIPKTRGGEVHWSDYKDWNLTCLAIALFCYLLTVVRLDSLCGAFKGPDARILGFVPDQVCLCEERVSLGLRATWLLHLCDGRSPRDSPAFRSAL